MSTLEAVQDAQLEDAQPEVTQESQELWRQSTTFLGVEITIRLMYKTGYYLSVSGRLGGCSGTADLPVAGNGRVERRIVVCGHGIHGRVEVTNWKENGSRIAFKMDCYGGHDRSPWFHIGTFYPVGTRKPFESQEEAMNALKAALKDLSTGEPTPGAPRN